MDKTLEKLLTGLSDNNIRFDELTSLLVRLGFKEHIKGDHHIFITNNVLEIINLQPLGNGKSKIYQVKQVRKIILKYKLNREVDDV